MSEPVSTPLAGSDQNLLFGVLALQAGLLDAVQFAEACSAWATRPDEEIADLLVERHWLTADDRADVERLLERKLRKQGSRPRTDEAAGTPTGGATPAPTETTVPYISLLPAMRYERKTLHAEGGMGQIWRGQDPDLGREVALKVLRPDQANDRQLRERFLQEARIMGQLSHPGIPPVHVLSQDDCGTPYYAMKFIEGRTLEEAIAAYHRQPTPLAFRALLRHFGDICQTVAFAHSRAIVHRDLKPRNVMIGDFGETYVLDWGLAKQVKPAGDTPPQGLRDFDQGLTQVGQILGTPAYIPPEQLTGSPAGPLTDLYALGVILYEILAGRQPYQGNSTLEILVQASKGQITPPSQLRGDAVPRKLEEICLKATALRPGDRYQSAGELTGAVEDWLSDELVRSEAALRRQTGILQSILNSMSDGVLVADAEGNLLLINPAAERILGHPPEPTLAGILSMNALFRPDMSTRFETHDLPLARAIRGEEVDDAELFVRHGDAADGIWTSANARPVRDEDGNIRASVVVLRDITERKRVEQELVRSRERFELAVKGSQDGLWDWDVLNDELYYAPRFKEIMGYADHEIAHRVDEWSSRLHPDERERVLAANYAAIDGKTPHYECEYRLRHRDGSYRWILARGVALRDAAGKGYRMAGSIADITER